MGFYFDKFLDSVDYLFNTTKVEREIDNAHNYSLEHPDGPPKELSAQAKAHLYEVKTNDLAKEMVKKYNGGSDRNDGVGRVVGNYDSYSMNLYGTNKNQLADAAGRAAREVGGELTISTEQGAPIGVSGLGGKDDDYDFHIPSTVFTIKKE